MLSINPKHLFKIVAAFAFASAICFFQMNRDKGEGWWAVSGSLCAALCIYFGYKVYKESKNK